MLGKFGGLTKLPVIQDRDSSVEDRRIGRNHLHAKKRNCRFCNYHEIDFETNRANKVFVDI